MNSLQISVIIPLFNEAESLPELHDWIVRVMEANNFSYEILFMNDGSTDDSPNRRDGDCPPITSGIPEI